MKILYIGGMNWPPETFLGNLIEGLSKEKIQIHVVTSFQRSCSALSQSQFLKRIYLPKKIPFRIRIFLLKLIVLIYRYDLIYFPWNSSAIEHLDLFESNIPVVLSCRGSQINIAPHNPDRYSIKAGLKKTFDKATKVHCVSKAIQNEAQKYGLDPKKSQVIRPAISTKFFTPLQSNQSQNLFRIVMVGNLQWSKGYEYAFLAMKDLVDRKIPVHLSVVGCGPEKERIVYTLHDLGLSQQVVLYDQKTQEQIRSLIQKSDIFLLTSLSEGISNAAIEAMSCGVPVISSDCGGMNELIESGKDGLIIPMRSSQAVTDAIEKLYQDREFKRELGENAREKIVSHFDDQNQIQNFVAMFKDAK